MEQDSKPVGLDRDYPGAVPVLRSVPMASYFLILGSISISQLSQFVLALSGDARVHFWPPRFDFIAATIRQWSAPGSESRS
jgi:hypothetical protein